MALPAAIGRYEIVARLATGGMAEILLAQIRGPESFERPVVIKRILSHLSTQALEKMFLEEARIAASIRHPNVVQVHELGSEGGELYLAMEYLEGESASSLVRRLTLRHDRLGYALAAYVASEIGAGLHAAHDLRGNEKQPLQLVHRDVSPHNVFITYDGDVKLLDFGIAKTALSSAKTDAGVIRGKFAYMSPEQCQAHELDRRSDVFSLGTVLYELATGRQLYQRDSAMQTMQAICTECLVPPSSIDPDFPPRLSEVCVKALSHDRADRYATAAEMRRELVAVQRSLAPESDLREELGRLMHTLYADRIEAKERMLQSVRVGRAPDDVPEGEADVDVDVPVAVDATVGNAPTPGIDARSAAGTDGRSPGSRRRGLVGVVISALALLLVGAAFLGQRTATPSRPVVAATSSVVVGPSPSLDAGAEVPMEVGLSLSSAPPGASILVDGQPRGTTPASLRLPRSHSPTRIELVLAGHLPLIQEIVPDVDQRLVLSLTAQRARSTAGRVASPPPTVVPKATSQPSSAPAPSAKPEGFTRFN